MTEIEKDGRSKPTPSGGTCRACMLFDDSTRMIYLFECNNNLAEIFSKCTSLETTAIDDGLPKHICLNCHNDLVNYNKFRLLCTASDTYFRQKVQSESILKSEHVHEEVNPTVQEDVIVQNVEDRSQSSDVAYEEIIEESRDDPPHDENIEEISNLHSEDPDVNGTDTAAGKDEIDQDDLDTNVDGASKKSTLSCEECGKKFFKLHRLEGHLRQHKGLKPCVCGICGRAFSKWSGLSLHMSGWHNNKSEKKQFLCDAENCDKAYNMKQSLSLHKKNRHSEASEAITVQEIKCVCEICGKQFKTSNALKKHTYTHTGYDNMPYSCSICPKKYTTKHKLKEHTMRHDGVKNHICPFCGLRKTTPHELKVHINYHTREKLYPCKLCNAEFSSIGNMSRHFKIVHCGIKAYTCTICDRSFGKSETLKHHTYTHTGEKPHACNICNKRFIQSIALQTHMKTHKKVT